jgi:hypothetical protein
MHASCLCGDVSWDVEGPFELMHHCHCGICRKTHGAAFATVVAVPAHGLHLRGAERIVAWESSPGFWRRFCGRCGSAVPGNATDGRVFVPCGNLDGDPGVAILAHIFTASKAPWYEISDGIPRFEAYPPGFEAPVLPDAPLAPRPSGVTRGSCNCGAVAFEYEGAPILCRNCHCGRCRRGRSAAHASNLGLRVAQFRWTRGEDRVATWKVPDAKFFAQAFCTTCGSKLPRVDASRDLVVVPLGSLDDDPGVRPTEHIFVADKAPWFEITDSLPQHAEHAPSS